MRAYRIHLCPTFSSFLIFIFIRIITEGPCALDFTCVKICDKQWQDPNADELIQRYRMQGASSFGQQTNQVGHKKPFHIKALAEKSIDQTKTTADPASSTPSMTSAPAIRNVTKSENKLNSYKVNRVTSPKLKLGQSASIMAKRKASISALEDISNSTNSSKFNVSPSSPGPSPRSLKLMQISIKEMPDKTSGHAETTPQMQNKTHTLLRPDNNSSDSGKNHFIK